MTWASGMGEIFAVAIEGTGSYGRGLSALLQSRDVHVVEVSRPAREDRRNRGKADLSDAEAAARAFLAGKVQATPRGNDATIAMIRSVRIPREALVNQRTQAINQLRALIVTAPAALRESLAGLTAKQLIDRAAHFRVGVVASPPDASRFAMRQLARHVLNIDVQVEGLDQQLDPLVSARAPELLAIYGVGIEVASNLLVAWDNARRIRSEAAFASLCGVAPVPASSGKDKPASS